MNEHYQFTDRRTHFPIFIHNYFTIIMDDHVSHDHLKSNLQIVQSIL